MTVETASSGEPIVKSGPYTGDGSTSAFDYEFKIQSDTELKVVRQNADLTETVLTLDTHYTVAGVGSATGGAITVLTPATNLPAGTKLVILFDGDFNQSTDYANQSKIYLATLEDVLDDIVMHTRQLKELTERSIKMDPFNTVDLDALTANINALALIESDIVSVAGLTADVSTVAAIDTDVTTVAGISADVTTVAGINADVTTVAGISTNVTTVAAVAADVTTVAGYDPVAIAADAVAAAASATAAAASQSTASSHEAAAQGYKDDAQIAASNAATSEANASTSASNASTSAGNASTSESNASTSAGNAATSETNAATSASNAAASETAAAASETAAAASASTLTYASQAEAEAGTVADKVMSPLTTAQAISDRLFTADTILVRGNSYEATTGIPAGARRITVTIRQLSVDGSEDGLVQVGAGSYTTSGYVVGGTRVVGTTVSRVDETTGIPINMGAATRQVSGLITLTREQGTNSWLISVDLSGKGSGVSGSKDDLTGYLNSVGDINQIRFTAGGSDEYDIGVASIMAEL